MLVAGVINGLHSRSSPAE